MGVGSPTERFSTWGHFVSFHVVSEEVPQTISWVFSLLSLPHFRDVFCWPQPLLQSEVPKGKESWTHSTVLQKKWLALSYFLTYLESSQRSVLVFQATNKALKHQQNYHSTHNHGRGKWIHSPLPRGRKSLPSPRFCRSFRCYCWLRKSCTSW